MDDFLVLREQRRARLRRLAVEGLSYGELPQREPAARAAFATFLPLGARCIPSDVLELIGRFVGLLPSVDEAMDIARPELRKVLERATKKHIKAKVSAQALICDYLLPLSHASASADERRVLYKTALARREVRRRRDEDVKERLAALRHQLAAAREAARRAELQTQILALLRGGPAK
ncbi:hypothetical protein M885DRAFT_612047 [Pelagophyceae sp. CCMP2097]|nr:hypothetical protein M885DRAFT_612047 [Pelagophyceae sp. CCMP2097]|mmetsp:Transcript_20519/g.69549  ORF Transcript_20519/g.69549 Transcript_20519/m.69549 type:complete len:177 (+) Transcript_20519:81-611(+)